MRNIVKRKTYLLIIISLFIVQNINTQERGHGQDEYPEYVIGSNIAGAGKQWAVFIAIDEYLNNEPLDYPVKDALEIKRILQEKYIISVDEWCELYNENATADGIHSLFMRLKDEVKEEDSVFIFHAGHGSKDDEMDTGAWIPYDAGINRYERWIGHNDIRTYLNMIPAIHVLLVSDSCYSGDLLTRPRAGVSTQIDENYYRRTYSFTSRQIMTSGAIETVPDKSDFAELFKDTLRRADGLCISPLEIFVRVNRANGSTPRFGDVPGTPYSDGNFLFFLKGAERFMEELTTRIPYIEIPPENGNGAVAIRPERGTREYFIGKWTATTEYNGSYDDYEIELLANGRCNVKIINDYAEQETTGNWSWEDGTYFRLDAVFRNANIPYQNNIQWRSIVSFIDSESFILLGKPAVNAPNPVRITLYRE